MTWRSAESLDLRVEYVDIYGKTKKHYADFFVDGKIVVEIKPRRLQKTKTVQLKANAMRAFCDIHNYVYMMVAPRRIPIKDLEELVDNGTIKLTDDSKKKYKGYISRNKRKKKP